MEGKEDTWQEGLKETEKQDLKPLKVKQKQESTQKNML